MRAAGRRRIGRFAVAAVCTALAVSTTWPLAASPFSKLPVGTEPAATVPLFNLWTIWWNADRALHGWAGYWDAPIFHPADDAFAFSEPQPTTLLVAPIVWFTGSRVLAYNAYLWLSLVLNGAFAARLLRLLGVGRWASAWGGAAMLLLPIVHWQLGVAQLVPLWGALWTWAALVKVFRRPTFARGAELGAAFALTVLTCVHHGLFLSVLLAGAGWLAIPWPSRLRTRAGAFAVTSLAAAVVAAGLAGPVVTKLHDVAARYEFTRPPELVAQLSAEPRDYASSPARLRWLDLGDPERPFWLLSAGWLPAGVAAAGTAFGLWRRNRRRWTAFLVVTTVLAFLLSLGPNLRVGSWEPYATLADVWPGFAQVRNVFRFAYFAQAGVVLLAAQGLNGFWKLGRRGFRGRTGRYAVSAAVSLLGLAALVEMYPARPRLVAAPDAVANAGWIDFVRRESPPGRAIACVPLAAGRQATDFETTTCWMYYGTFHAAPMVNGYSGFFPPEHLELVDATATLPPRDGLRLLAEAGTSLLVVDRVAAPGVRERGGPALEPVFSDPVGIDVYRLTVPE